MSPRRSPPVLPCCDRLSGQLPVGRFFLDDLAGRAGRLLNALGLWKEAVWEGHLGPEVTAEGGRLASSALRFGVEVSLSKLAGFGRAGV